MAEVMLTVGGRRYQLACRDGEEAHLRALAAMVDVKAAEAARAVGTANETRQLLLAALLLADEVSGGARKPAADDDDLAAPIEALADRIESLAAHLEKGVTNA